MIVSISNAFLEAKINTLGAELVFLKNRKTGRVLVRPDQVGRFSTIGAMLFPAVSAVKDGYILVDDASYPLPMSGFARSSDFAVLEQTEDRLSLMLCETEETKRVFPYAFCLQVVFALEENCLRVQMRVKNTADRTLSFAIGGHPFFSCAPEDDWCLEFDAPVTAGRLVRENFLVTGVEEQFLLDTKTLPITAELFQNGAVALVGLPTITVHLRGKNAGRVLTFKAEDFKTLTLWAPPEAQLRFFNLECWNGAPDRADSDHDWEQNPNLTKLSAGEERSYTYTIQAEA